MIKTNVTPPEKTLTLEAFKDYLYLSSLLFDPRSGDIYNVTDIPENNKFFQVAKDKAGEMKITWDGMTHTQSNRVMLAMLEDAFNLIKDVDSSNSIILKLKLVING